MARFTWPLPAEAGLAVPTRHRMDTTTAIDRAREVMAVSPTCFAPNLPPLRRHFETELCSCDYRICSCDRLSLAHNRSMTGYGQFCPVARASEIFAERWTPLILGEVMSERHHFNEILRGLHGCSPTLLRERLRRLERADVIEARPNPSGRGSTYYLTPSGTQLTEVVRALGAWGQYWLELEREHIDPDYLMWAIFTHLAEDALP